MKPEKNPERCSDAELLCLLTKGDKNALIMIYDRYATDLYAYLIPLVRTRVSGKEARERTMQILIDIFIPLWDDREKLVIPSVLSEYLYSTAYHKAVNYLLHRKDPQDTEITRNLFIDA